MKTIRFRTGAALLPLSFLVATVVASAQTTLLSVPTPTVIGTINDSATKPVLVQDSSSTTHLDNAVAALNKGDKATTTQELQTGISGLEAEAQAKPTSFKDKILAQVGKLKALLPLIAGGGLSGGVLGKAVGLAKLASGGNQLEGLLSAGSLIGKGSQLTSSLSGLGSAMSVLGGGASTGQSLISTALGSVSKLDQGGLTAKAAEPVAKSQIGSVLNFVKGAL